MRKTLLILIAVAIATAFAMTPALAGDMSGKSKATSGKSTMKSSATMKASELIGKSVMNKQGELLGKIDDLAVDTQSGQITFAVLSVGGALGIGNKLIPVPINALEVSEKQATLDISKDKLASAPSFEEKDWNAMSSRKQMEDTYKFFGVRPYWEGQGTM